MQTGNSSVEEILTDLAKHQKYPDDVGVAFAETSAAPVVKPKERPPAVTAAFITGGFGVVGVLIAGVVALYNESKKLAPSAEAAQAATMFVRPSVERSAQFQTRVSDQGDVELVRISGGTFTMGSPDSEVDRSPEEEQHDVTLSPFWLGKHEVTRAQFRSYLEANAQVSVAEEWEKFQWDGYPGHMPMFGVTWDEAAAFATWAGGRLPTEAEWEYAARADTRMTFPWGNVFDGKRSNCDGGWKAPLNLASLPSNPWGLHDMHGNVWEWTADWYGSYDLSVNTDPTGANTGHDRVLRGGSWGDGSWHCRSAARRGAPPNGRSSLVGFRLAANATMSGAEH